MMKGADIRPQQVYQNKRGEKYQVITLARQIQTEEQLVVYQELFGEFQMLACPADAFCVSMDTGSKRHPIESAARRKAVTSDSETPAKNLQGQDVASEAPVSAADSPEKADALRSEKEKDGDGMSSPLPSEEDAQDASSRMLAFLDTRDFEKKYEILKEMYIRKELTDNIIDNLAAALDVVIEEGDMAKRYDQLKACVQTRLRYESTRLR